jgi:hypothetical protein
MTPEPEGFLSQEIVEVVHVPGALSFRAGPQLAQLVREWERSNDELVFKTQLETGSFHGQLSVDEPVIQNLMLSAAAEGTILPYYGAGGNRGACVFKFLPGPTRCLIEVEHTVTGAVLSLEAEAPPPEERPAESGTLRFIFSFLPVLTGGEAAAGPSAQPVSELSCRITGREYERLARWQHWDAGAALSERYWYVFGVVSLGRQGLTVRVTDTRSGATLDATDYDDW